MSSFPLEKFLALVDVDRSLIKIDKDLETLALEIEEAQVKRKAHEDAIERYKANEREKRKAVDACELRMKELDQQRSLCVGRLDTATNEKEYAALKSEIDRIKEAQHNLETELLAVWKAYETAQVESQTKEKELQGHIAVLDAVIQEKMQATARLQDEKQEIIAQRMKKEEMVPSDWLERYSTMQQRVTDPVVPVEGTSCSACFYNVLQQDLIDLKKRKLLQCRDCFRLLFMPDFLEQSQTSSENEITSQS